MNAEREIIVPPNDNLSDLQDRCIDAIARDWLVMNLEDETIQLLQKQYPLVLGEMFRRSLLAAQQEVNRFIRLPNNFIGTIQPHHDDSELVMPTKTSSSGTNDGAASKLYYFGNNAFVKHPVFYFN